MKIKLLRSIMALTILFSACNKGVLNQIKDEDTVGAIPNTKAAVMMQAPGVLSTWDTFNNLPASSEFKDQSVIAAGVKYVNGGSYFVFDKVAVPGTYTVIGIDKNNNKATAATWTIVYEGVSGNYALGAVEGIKLTGQQMAKFKVVEIIKVEPEQGVEINGVVWATRNVDAVGTFAAKPEDPGMFYQWNRKKAWPSTGATVPGWDATNSTGATWETANDPCPNGWRMPIREEIEKLIDTKKVNDEWILVNGVSGRRFIDQTTSRSIFFPAVGLRSYDEGELFYAGLVGYYWSSTDYYSGTDMNGTNAYALSFSGVYTSPNSNAHFPYGLSVRCVK
jgi:uncharacterized protein (TIGR02145 family)